MSNDKKNVVAQSLLLLLAHHVTEICAGSDRGLCRQPVTVSCAGSDRELCRQ